MINANELRIGNWVYTSAHGMFLQVIVIDTVMENIKCIVPQADNDRWGFAYFELEPIPLTPEILEKAGFAKLPDEGRLLYAIDITNEISIYTYPNAGTLGISISAPEYRDYPCNECNDGLLDSVKYLHQLQNLIFSLTGKELNITL